MTEMGKEDVLEKLSPGSGMRILVIDGRRLVGIIPARDISRIVQRHALRLEPECVLSDGM
jgi:hypothetical protein